MKNIVFVLALLLSFASKADQLAYISESEAIAAVEKIEKMADIYIFCGCCSIIKPEKIKILSVKAHHTGYENYFEVVIMYERENRTVESRSVDLAYIWKKGLFEYKTLGEKLRLEHDFCVNPKDWDNPANTEKDI